MMTIFIIVLVSIFAAPILVITLGLVVWTNDTIFEMELKNDDELYLIR